MDEKIPCKECGVLILPATARKTGGLCMPCHGGYRRDIKVQRGLHMVEATPTERQERLYKAYRRGLIGLDEYETALFCAEIRLTGPLVQGEDFYLQLDFHNSADHDILLDFALDTEEDVRIVAGKNLSIEDESGNSIHFEGYMAFPILFIMPLLGGAWHGTPNSLRPSYRREAGIRFFFRGS